MSTHYIPFSISRENQPKLSQISSFGIFSTGLKHKLETAMVNEPSEFKPLQIYCMSILVCHAPVKIPLITPPGAKEDRQRVPLLVSV